jgi:hypothetical protein
MRTSLIDRRCLGSEEDLNADVDVPDRRRGESRIVTGWVGGELPRTPRSRRRVHPSSDRGRRPPNDPSPEDDEHRVESVRGVHDRNNRQEDRPNDGAPDAVGRVGMQTTSHFSSIADVPRLAPLRDGRRPQRRDPDPSERPRTASDRGRLASLPELQGIRMSLCSLAIRLSSSLSSDSLTGVTIDQCLPTGQR